MTELRLQKPLKYDISGPAYKRAPVATIRQMQTAGAVIPVKVMLIGKVWMPTTHAANIAFMKDKDLFVQEGRNAGTTGVGGIQWWMPKSIRLMTNNMLLKDEPDHRRLRTLVDQAFHRRGVADMRDGIAALADRLLDEMDARGDTDLVDGYARRLPLYVICDLLGFSHDDHDYFADISQSALNITSITGAIGMFSALKRLIKYVREQIEICRQHPRDGLIRELITAEEDGDSLSEDELVSMVIMLLIAGFETTTHLISGAIFTLDQHPDEKAWLLENTDERMEPTVEEVLRFWAPVQNTKPRYIARDTEFFGQPLKRGDKMMAFIPGANMDADVFETPEKFDPGRFPNPHLSFSSGIHFCLGLQLARLEAQVALERLYARRPEIRLVAPTDDDFVARIGIRGFKTLQIAS